MTAVTQVDEQARFERQDCVRRLLSTPLLTDSDRDILVKVRRHASWLRTWFSDQLGYRLVVEPGFARLKKRLPPDGITRPLRTKSGTAFDRRRYALLCLVLAAIEKTGVQTTLSELADHVKVFSNEREGVEAIAFDRLAERQSFVDSVRHLVSLGFLQLTDGDDRSFLEDKGDALYDVDTRLLSHALACSVPPSIAGSVDALDPAEYSNTDAGKNRHARHRIMRRLVEEPILYFKDLDTDEADYMAYQRHYLLKQAHEGLGLDAEIRREGIALIDTNGQCTDLRFPGTGTVSHAALLLAERIGEISRTQDDMDKLDAPAKPIARQDLRKDLERLTIEYKRYWAKTRIGDVASREQLFAEALDMLAGMGLIQISPEAIIPLPAIARYAAPEIAIAGSSLDEPGHPMPKPPSTPKQHPDLFAGSSYPGSSYSGSSATGNLFGDA